jgi:hypothetical protein
MEINLIKVGEKKMSFTHTLRYIYEKPDNKKLWKFFKYDIKKDEMEEIIIKSIKF